MKNSYFTFHKKFLKIISKTIVFRKAFRILGLGERKVGGQWNKFFMEIFRSMLHGFLPLSPLSFNELCSFWYGLKDLFTLHKLADKAVLDCYN